MSRFNRVILTTVEEDFRKIGLLPELSEADDPTKPRDIPSPAPEAGEGLDDSEGEKSAHQAGAKQPKPKMGPAADDAKKSGLNPDEDGGSVGAQKGGKGGSTKVAGGKEESKQYVKMGKQPMAGAKGKNKGEKAQAARGLKPVKKHAGMQKESKFSKAASLVEEVQGLLSSVQIDEEIDELVRGFQLVSENSALLADRLTEVSDQYQVEALISEMEELSADAAEAIDIIEMELADMGSDSDEEEAVRHSTDVSEEADLDETDTKKKSDRNAEETYDIPSPAFKGESEMVLNAMVSKLMETLESYDNILDEMGMMPEMEAADDEDGGHEVHVHTKAKKVHIHHAQGDDDDADADDDQDDGSDADMHADDGQDDGQDDGGDDADMHAHGGDDDMDAGADDDGMDQGDDDGQDADDGSGDDADYDSDQDQNSLAARMKALKARREAMGGGRSFR